MRHLTETHMEVVQRMRLLMSDLHSSTTELLRKIGAISISPDILSTPLGDAAKTLTAEAEALRKSIHDASASIAETLADGLDGVRRSADRVDSAIEGMKAFELLAREAESAAQAMTAGNSALQVTFDQTGRLLKDLAEAVADIQDSTNQDVKKIRGDIEAAAGDIRALGKTIQQDAQKYSDALTQSIRLLRGEVERG
jgi:hypothetical protein